MSREITRMSRVKPGTHGSYDARNGKYVISIQCQPKVRRFNQDILTTFHSVCTHLREPGTNFCWTVLSTQTWYSFLTVSVHVTLKVRIYDARNTESTSFRFSKSRKYVKSIKIFWRHFPVCVYTHTWTWNTFLLDSTTWYSFMSLLTVSVHLVPCIWLSTATEYSQKLC